MCCHSWVEIQGIFNARLWPVSTIVGEVFFCVLQVSVLVVKFEGLLEDDNTWLYMKGSPLLINTFHKLCPWQTSLSRDAISLIFLFVQGTVHVWKCPPFPMGMMKSRKYTIFGLVVSRDRNSVMGIIIRVVRGSFNILDVISIGGVKQRVSAAQYSVLTPVFCCDLDIDRRSD